MSLHARPIDYIVAFGDAYASIPVSGRYLEPVGALTAVGALGFVERLRAISNQPVAYWSCPALAAASI